LFLMRHDAIRPCPGKPLLGACARTIFAADEAGVAEPIERRENCRIVDFALIGLAPLRHRSDLHVADQRQVRLEAAIRSPDTICT
jgi:hypothetical protein